MVISFFNKVLDYMVETKYGLDEAFDKFFPEFEIAIRKEIIRGLLMEAETKEK